jgi:hypothetical protein
MKAILVFALLIFFSCNQGDKNQSSQLNSKYTTMDKNLIGTWNSDDTDETTQKTLGKVTMTFTEDGKLVYDIFGDNKLQRMNMIYKVQGDTIISDQPSHPQEQRTNYKIESRDKLILDFKGEKTVFKRQTH